MIRHIVMFTFREETQVPERKEALLRMEEFLRTQRYGTSSWLGKDACLAPGNASVVIMVDFPDPQAFSDFQASNEHLATLRSIRTVIDTRTAIQSTVKDP